VHLAEIGVLDRNVTLAHVNHVTDAECDAIVETGASIVWAPAASMMWGHGSSLTARHAELWLRGANVALGSDSPNWSNDFDLFKQISLAVLVTRERSRQRDRLIAEDGLFMATRGGARAAGLDHLVGSIEVGKRADLVVHTLRRPELLPRTDMVRNLVYSARSKSVATVIVDGRVVLDDGRFTQVDADAILSRVDERSADLLQRMRVSAERNRIERAQRMAVWLRRR
jgi:cytosine/adenosine deaminase-related metal-dependent hydrolase